MSEKSILDLGDDLRRLLGNNLPELPKLERLSWEGLEDEELKDELKWKEESFRS